MELTKSLKVIALLTIITFALSFSCLAEKDEYSAPKGKKETGRELMRREFVMPGVSSDASKFTIWERIAVGEILRWNKFVVGMSREDNSRLASRGCLMITLKFKKDDAYIKFWGNERHLSILLSAVLKGTEEHFIVCYERLDSPAKKDKDNEFLTGLSQKYPGLNLPRYRLTKIQEAISI